MTENNTKMALSPGHFLDEERVRRISPSVNSRMKLMNKEIRLATWNVRSLFQAGKMHNAELERKRLKLAILGLSEVRWPGTGTCDSGGSTMYYSGGTEVTHRNGVAIMVDKKIVNSVKCFVPISDRVMLLKMESNYRDVNLIQIYAPTADKEEEEREKFYEQVTEAFKLTRKGEIVLIMGDFNAKVGSGAVPEVVGSYGLGDRNEAGDVLVSYCVSREMVISNTLFKLPKRRLYTWKSPKDTKENIIRNQIDYILINKSMRKFVKAVKTYPGADINSDHNPVVMSLRLRFQKKKTYNKRKRIDIEKIQKSETKTQIRKNLSQGFKNIHEEILQNEEDTIDENAINVTWVKMKEVCEEIQNEVIGTVTMTKKKSWMTDEILEMMEERRKVKDKDAGKYRQIHKHIRAEIRRAKENWLSKKCEEMEELDKRHDSFNMHKEIKSITGTFRKKNVAVIKDTDGKILTEHEKKKERWVDYIRELFLDEERNDLMEELERDNENEENNDITRQEIETAIKDMKQRKATGPDRIHGEILKTLCNSSVEDNQDVWNLLVRFFNSIYGTGIIPDEWCISTFITLPKKQNATECSEYRTISLMSHILKIFLKIIHRRIYKKCEEHAGKNQFGFRNGLGTREAICALNVLAQRCRDVNRNLYLCFIDYKKAFDNVKHRKLVDILQKIGIGRKECRLIKNLYWRQSANIIVDEEESEDIRISKGVRQGCILSPMLFNIYSEAIFREALEETSLGIKINDEVISEIRYADDTVLISDSDTKLQEMVNRVNESSRNFGLEMNINKTKFMIIHKERLSENIASVKITVEGQEIERVRTYLYLGTWIHDQTDQNLELRTRIEKARATFTKMRTLFSGSGISLKLRLRMVKCYIYSILLYGAESWTLTKQMEKKIEAFEMYIFRRILRISWTDKVRNETVLQRMNTERELLHIVQRRKMEYLGHVMRGEKYELFKLILNGNIEGRRSAGRRKLSWMADLRRWFGKSTQEILGAAVSKISIIRMIANLQRGDGG